jgi:hypothetical protein
MSRACSTIRRDENYVTNFTRKPKDEQFWRSRHRLKDNIKITGWTIGVLGFDYRRGLKIFLFTTATRTALGPTQPPIQWVTGALSLGVKRPGREADHSISCRGQRMSGAIPRLPQYVFMAWCSVKAQGQLYLLLLPWSWFLSRVIKKAVVI